MEEIWKDVKGYEGLYEVSNFGNIKSLARTVTSKNGVVKSFETKFLKPVQGNGGYLQVNLVKEKIKKIHKIHKLVAVAFLGHTPNGHELVVDHINNNNQNNKLENLQLVTNRYNSSKDKKNKTSKWTGVSKRKNRCSWRACIRINGKVKELGMYKCETAAHFAYLKALKEAEGR